MVSANFGRARWGCKHLMLWLACPATEKCKHYRGRVGLSFYWNVFDIKGMVWEKMVNVNFGGIR